MSVLFDLHVHTAEVSRCAHASGAQMAAQYRALGYDGFVLTNHMTPEYILDFSSHEDCIAEYAGGFHAARDAGEALGLTVLPGMELRFAEGNNDYLVYGFSIDMVPELMQTVHWGLAHFFETYHDRLAIIQAHPCRTYSSAPADACYLHGVEILNTSHASEFNALARRHWRANAAQLVATAGCDAHNVADVGRTGVLFEQRPTSGAELAHLLKTGAFTISRNPRVKP